MKKEFKAPIVETKILSTENSIMDGSILISNNAEAKNLTVVDVEVNDNYNLWKSGR